MENEAMTVNLCVECLPIMADISPNTKSRFFGLCDLCLVKPENRDCYQFNIADESAELIGEKNEP